MKFQLFDSIRLISLTLIFLIVAGCADTRLDWDDIIETNELRFVTTESPATYYESPTGPAGFEYELARRFADSIGVKLKIITVNRSHDVVDSVIHHKASIGGATLINAGVDASLKFGPAYFSVPQQLIYRRGDERPVSIPDTNGHNPAISLTQLGILKDQYPQVTWNAYSDRDIDVLLRMVQHREIKSAVATTQHVNIYKHLYPDIRVAFDITKPQPVAWLYQDDDEKLHAAITKFFNKLEETGELDKLVEHYFGHIIAFDYIDTSTFLTRVDNRLPEFEELFKTIAGRYGMDWTLLAAISYQESHWQPSARSPTGVRGLMMLTQDTAEQLGVDDRVDPEQSVDGGTRYFKLLLDKLPDRISYPDNIWFALAAYNVGLHHLEHARVVTQQGGGNPDSWSEVRKTLMKLGDDNWQPSTQNGPVRWNEPVRYVRNIRKYRDILRWLTFEKNRMARNNERLHALSIDSPVL
jgi:membrane-bound lytic murein transglycosylase F